MIAMEDLFVLLGHCPVVVAELWGALYALELAWSLDISHLILELDSSSAVSLIKHCVDRRHPYAPLILKIKHLLDRSWQIKVEHIFREANRVADFMTSMGHALDFGLHVFYNPPERLYGVLSKDFRGVVLPRLIT